jgi:zinc transport system permease protein
MYNLFSSSLLEELFSYSFIVRALIVGGLVSLCAALLGVSLVLKRYSMIGDGLSHVGFGALAIAMAMNLAPLTISIPVVVLAAFLLLRISENSKIKGDAAIALISSSALAIGIIVTSITKGMNTDVYNYMFGSILVMNVDDVYLSVVLSVVVLILFIVFYNKIFAVTFDESFAKATGTKSNLYNMLIAFLTAITIVVGMRIMGTLLISSLIIFPALTSMRVCRSFRSVVISSAFVSVACFFLGIVLSFALELPAGASVVTVNLIVFCIFSLFGNLMRRRYRMI